MIEFLTPTTNAATALPATHVVTLVALSGFVVIFACYTGLLLSERFKFAEGLQHRWMWIAVGSVIMGIGIWAMHFIGMLALVLPIPVTYDLMITTASAVPAVLASGVVLYVIASGELSHRRRMIAGSLLGVAVAATHYIGTGAMHMAAVVKYDPVLFALSILVSVGLGIAVLYARSLTNRSSALGGSLWLQPTDAAVMGLALFGLDHLAMGATYFVPAPDGGGEQMALSPLWLSIEITVIVAVVLTIALANAVATADKQRQSASHLAQVTRQRMTEALESISDGFTLFDGSGTLLMCNKVFRDMYPSLDDVLLPGSDYEQVLMAWAGLQDGFPGGESAEDYVAQCMRRFYDNLAGDGYSHEEQLADGRWMYFRQHSLPSGGIVCIWADITSVKELQHLYEERAHHDALTGLPNRQLFDDRLEHAAAHALRLNTTMALLYVDLDRFKPINDTLGHDAGDSVLREVAKRLRVAVRDTDTVARLGGDEFAVILEPQGDRESAEMVATRILRGLSVPIPVNEAKCFLSASIGIAIMSAKEFDPAALVKAADAAMYEAKKSGRNCYRVGIT